VCFKRSFQKLSVKQCPEEQNLIDSIETFKALVFLFPLLCSRKALNENIMTKGGRRRRDL
jgi:hypothetical protein